MSTIASGRLLQSQSNAGRLIMEEQRLWRRNHRIRLLSAPSRSFALARKPEAIGPQHRSSDLHASSWIRRTSTRLAGSLNLTLPGSSYGRPTRLRDNRRRFARSTGRLKCPSRHSPSMGWEVVRGAEAAPAQISTRSSLRLSTPQTKSNPGSVRRLADSDLQASAQLRRHFR
jgi:hypothetical protein